jgi:predicted TPR repeat methyltransferase
MYSNNQKKNNHKSQSYSEVQGSKNGKEEFNVVLSLMEQGSWNEAIKHLIHLLSIFPQKPILYRLIGEAYFNVSNYHESLRNFSIALKFKSSDIGIINNIALCLNKLKKFDKTESFIEQYIDHPDISASIYIAYCFALQSLGKNTKCIKAYGKGVEKFPNNIELLSNLGNRYFADHDYQSAKTVFEKIKEIDPNNISNNYLLLVLNGNKPDRTPPEHIKNLFDYYALTFEHHLLHSLNYNLPKVFSSIIQSKSHGLFEFNKVLDMGCGTGIFGEIMSKKCKSIDGLDISEEMIKQSHNRYVYDNLYCDDIIHFLQNNRLDHDLITAFDTLIYFGDLNDVFQLIKEKNDTSEIHFIFSLESIISNSDYEIDLSGRYKHSKRYIDNISSKYGWKKLMEHDCELRIEKGQPVHGTLYHFCTIK